MNDKMLAYKLIILGLSEVKRNGHGEIRSDSNVSLLYSDRRNENDVYRDVVGLILTRDIRKSLIE